MQSKIKIKPKLTQAHNRAIKLKKSKLSELSLVKCLSDHILENSA